MAELHLDPFTLAASMLLASGAIGALLFFAWIRERANWALLSWGIWQWLTALGALLIARSSVLRDAGGMGPECRALGTLFVGCAYVFAWIGVKHYVHGRLDFRAVIFALAGPVWMLAVWFIAPESGLLAVGFSLAAGVYSWAAAASLQACHAEHALPSRRPAILVLTLHGLLFGGCVASQATMLFQGADPALISAADSWWHVYLPPESLVYIVAMGFLFLSLSRERAEGLYQAAATTDHLTGLLNRWSFLDFVGVLMELGRRHRRGCALVLFDLDHFKSINDTYGHMVGDRVLVVFADTLMRAVRPTDKIARWGGEEFVVFLPDVTLQGASLVAERIRSTFAECSAPSAGLLNPVTVSAGIACDPVGALSFDRLTAVADAALYRAKEGGRDRVEIDVVDQIPEKPVDLDHGNLGQTPEVAVSM